MSGETKIEGEVNEKSQETNTQKESEDFKFTAKTEKKETNVKGEDKPDKGNELLLGKYKTVDELAKGYRELETKLGKKPNFKEMKADDFTKYFKETYGNIEMDSSLDGDLLALSDELRNQTGVPSPIADYFVSESVNRVLGNQAKINKNEVVKLMKEEDFQENFRNGVELSGMSEEEAAKMINTGQLSVAQAKAWAKIGEQAPEGNLRKELEKEKDEVKGMEEAFAEIEKLTRYGSPFHNEADPEYLDYKRRVNQLKHKYNL